MIVVIGASSFIGTYLIDQLISQRREVFATCRNDLNRHYYKDRDVEYAQVDIAKAQALERLPEKDIEAVVLLASMMPNNDRECFAQPYIDINVTGTLNVLRILQKGWGKENNIWSFP